MFRRQTPDSPSPQFACVIGAGISGSSTARALAELGWHVTVIDCGHFGASSLPLGLISPHTSKDDGALSQLSRLGMDRMRVAMRTYLLEGVDWSPSGVMTYPRTGPVSDTNTVWHPDAAWIKPAALTRALLAHPLIQVIRDTVVDGLRFDMQTQSWLVFNSDTCLTQAEHVVLAAGPGCGAQALKTDSTPPFDAIRGQVTWGLMAQTAHAPWPANPINGRGSFVPHVPTLEGNAWFLGSTYDRLRTDVGVTEEDHAFNVHRLAELFPETASALAPLVYSDSVRGWVGVRCTLHDRLPFVGSVAAAAHGLWINSAMGSRGLTLGLLCSEILVALMTKHPPPVATNLVRAISSHRFIKKAWAKMQRNDQASGIPPRRDA
ncbi:MAG: FAD-dependent oxidoreductase [Burkholderiales bacterium]|nr:FAD-dependent oxidoreductase [Burkholderiales bacterium]